MKHFPESELIINADGSCFHLHLKPEQLADKVILVGDPARVNTVAAHFEGDDYTPEEWEEIEKFKMFVKSKRGQ